MLHQVGISDYFVRKMQVQTTLKFKLTHLQDVIPSDHKDRNRCLNTHCILNINSLELVLETFHYHILLLSHYNVMFTSCMAFRILIYQSFQKGDSVPRLIFLTCILFLHRVPWRWLFGAETCRRLIFVINFILSN